MPKVCAIHQPNFFPWLGYFDKIKKADVFILLDAVDYPKCGKGCWCNRVKLNYLGEAKYFTCPIKRKSGITPILEVEMLDDSWKEKLKTTLRCNYAKYPSFLKTFELLEEILSNSSILISEFNSQAIQKIADFLHLKTTFIKQSDLTFSGSATELLISLTKAAGCDTYLCGGGADGYQEDELFSQQGVQLLYQHFAPAPYGKKERFIPGLSVIDYLMELDPC